MSSRDREVDELLLHLVVRVPLDALPLRVLRPSLLGGPILACIPSWAGLVAALTSSQDVA